MICRDFSPLLSRFLDGELPASECPAVESHLKTCEECRLAYEGWCQQSRVFRAYLGRHAVNENFISSVRSAIDANAQEPIPGSRTGLRNGYRVGFWLKAAAAILLLFFLLSEFSPIGGGTHVARVVNPGSGLQVWSSSSPDWITTAVGSILSTGDWVRNPDPAEAEILIQDKSHLTLQQGTLAQLHGGRRDPHSQIRLIHGSLESETGAGAQDLIVQTPAGSVTGLGSRFGVRVRRLVLPRLQMSDDRSEILSGSILSLGDVDVRDGAISVEAAGDVRRVEAGDSAYFTATHFSQASRSRTGQRSVQALLRADSTNIAGRGSMHSSLSASGGAMEVRVELRDVPLRRLLEFATDSTVLGGDPVRVSGVLSFPVDSTKEAIVAAIGDSLGLPITYRQEQVRRSTAFLQEAGSLRTVAVSSQADFTIRRSASGQMSFSFNGVSAGDVFQSLRSEQIDLPELAASSEWVPVTLEATDLAPDQVAPVLERELGITLKEAGQTIRVVEIGERSAQDADQQNPVSAAGDPEDSHAALIYVPFGTPSGSDAAGLNKAPTQAIAPQSEYHTKGQSGRPLWSIIAGSLGIITRPAPEAAAGPTPGNSSDTAAVGMKDSAGEIMVTSQPSQRVIWPVLDRGAGKGLGSYSLSNTSDRTLKTTWFGFSANGSLVAQDEIAIAPLATVTVNPDRDLALPLEAGGHWETYGNGPMVVLDIPGMASSIGISADVGQIAPSWSFMTDAILTAGSDSGLWMVNATNATDRVVLALVVEGSAIASRQIFLPPHAGFLWSLDALLAGHPELGDLLPGSAIAVQALDGSVVAGVLPGSRENAAMPKGGERVH
jgi:hypothetical protein